MSITAFSHPDLDDAPRPGAMRDFPVAQRNPIALPSVRIPVTVTKVLVDIMQEDLGERGESIMGEALDKHIELQTGVQHQRWLIGQGSVVGRQQFPGTWKATGRKSVPSVEQYGRGPVVFFASEEEFRAHLRIVARTHKHVHTELAAMSPMERMKGDGMEMAKQDVAFAKYVKSLYATAYNLIGWRNGVRTLSREALTDWCKAAIQQGRNDQRLRFAAEDRYYLRVPLAIVEWCFGDIPSQLVVWRKVQERVKAGYEGSIGPLVMFDRDDIDAIVKTREVYAASKTLKSKDRAMSQAWGTMHDAIVQACDGTKNIVYPREKRARSPSVRDALAEISGVPERRARRVIKKRTFGTIPPPGPGIRERERIARERAAELHEHALHAKAGLVDPDDIPPTQKQVEEIEEFDRDERRQQKMNAWFDKHGDKTKAQVDEEERQKAEDEGQIH